MNKLNRDVWKNIADKTERMIAVMGELAKFKADDPPYLSDVYVNLVDGGQTALIALDRQEKSQMRPGGHPFTWKILVRRDEWGNPPSPGDKIRRVIPINRKDEDSRPVSPKVFNSARVDGSFANRFEEVREFVVDSKGCITCGFQDAGYFLFNWGIHHKTGYGLSNKPEYSSEPVHPPGAPEGTMMHVHYWRYSEVDAEDYEKLPTLKKATSPKRGAKE